MNLRELETRLQNLVEVDLLKILPGRNIEAVIIQKLAVVIQQNMDVVKGGSAALPDVYTLVMHPKTAQRWMNEGLLAVILYSISTVAQEAGFKFTIPPTITVKTDEKILANDAEILASYRMETMAETNAINQDPGDPNDHAEELPENCFLIVEGVKIFPLNVSVVNIGRRMDNQLIIDDPRISRNHAQLRSIKGRYVVFDLNSTGGTFVNGQRTSQSVLYPGDVISLAGLALIFGQDNPPAQQGLKDTSPFKNPVADRPTAALNKDDRSTAKFELKKK